MGATLTAVSMDSIAGLYYPYAVWKVAKFVRPRVTEDRALISAIRFLSTKTTMNIVMQTRLLLFVGGSGYNIKHLDDKLAKVSCLDKEARWLVLPYLLIKLVQ